MLDLEHCLHAELCAFLDDERLAFELLHASRGGEIDDNVRPAFYFETEGFNYAAAIITRFDGEGNTGSETEGGFPSVERFIVLV